MTRWSCPAPDCSKEWDSCHRVVSHLHVTSCKTVLSDPVAIAPFLAAASRWLCLACSKTLPARRPGTPGRLFAGTAASRPPPPLWPCLFLTSHRLKFLRPVFHLSLPFFAPGSQHLSTCPNQHAARWPRRGWSLLRLLRAPRPLWMTRRGFSFFRRLFSPMFPLRHPRAAFRRPPSSESACGVGPREMSLPCLRKLFVEPRNECQMEPPSQ
jgi:hypothetical protein